MKVIATLSLLLMLAAPVLAADAAKDPNVVINVEARDYQDQIYRGDAAVVAIIDGTFTDLSMVYGDALVAAGKTPDIFIDPMGAVDYSGYDIVIGDCADLWWAFDWVADEAAFAAYIDGGGKFFFVGQDYFYSRGGINGLPADYLGVAGVIEDTNYGDAEMMDWTGTEGGPLAGLADSMMPCFASNPWYTDNVDPGGTGLVMWGSPIAPGPQEGGSITLSAGYSAVEFGCGAVTNDVVAYLLAYFGGSTATEEMSWSAVKAQF